METTLYIRSKQLMPGSEHSFHSPLGVLTGRDKNRGARSQPSPLQEHAGATTHMRGGPSALLSFPSSVTHLSPAFLAKYPMWDRDRHMVARVCGQHSLLLSQHLSVYSFHVTATSVWSWSLYFAAPKPPQLPVPVCTAGCHQEEDGPLLTGCVAESD